MDSHFELILEQVSEGEFKASTPLFPRCKGQGSSREEAIEKLCSSISRHIASSTKFFLKSVFGSKEYSEVITDPSQKERFQHRVISLDQAGAASQDVFFKMMSVESLLSNTQDKSPFTNMQASALGANDFSAQSADESDQILRFQICLN